LKTYGIILAAGESTRFGADVNKLFYKVNDKELILYPIETFLKNESIDEVVIVSSGLNKSALENLFNNKYELTVIEGGLTRQESEYCAIQYLQKKATDNCFVAIHDAARCFLSSELLTNLIDAAKKYGSAAPYIESSKFYDTLTNEIAIQKKIVDIQTPQIYKYKELLDGYSYLSENGITNMVDTTESMYNFNKLQTHVIKGEENNLKITYMSDLNAFESTAKQL
tara:strand:- start:708 stop:1382 length:675 start_codon:yes stop_codon:yes gene_type:complete